jgi:solute:Na+ symporter, SSS family
MENTQIILSVVVCYFLFILGIGYISYRKTDTTIEDYFMADRQFGTLVLLMAVFATNMTAFIMIGMPGKAYHVGIGVFGWGIIFCCTYPVFFYFLGYRGWLLGKKYGYMTPCELFSDRYESDGVNLIMFILLIYYTIPYLVLGVIGGALAFSSMTQGAVPYWLGALIITCIVFAYTFLGGMRGTAWTNAIQGFVFIVAAWTAVILIAQSMGGFEAATQKVLSAKPELMKRTGFPVFSFKNWFSFMLVIQCGVAFPHLWIRLLTGKSHVTMQRMNLLYPIAGVLFWLPCIIVGVWGAAMIPGLAGKASDTIFPQMVAKFTNPLVAGLILAGIFAAVMSSLDAMILTVSTMFIRDILSKYRPQSVQGREVVSGRLFVAVISIITYLLALMRPGSIVGIAAYAFSGYVLFIPVMIAGLFWKKSTRHGVMAAMLSGTGALLLFQFGNIPSSFSFGFMPIVPCLILTTGVLILVSLFTAPPSEKTLHKFYGFLDPIFSGKKQSKQASGI